jgi:hypothetical protein
MVPPPLRLTGELIQRKDEVNAIKRQLNAMDRKLERLLDWAENESTSARSAPSTAAVNNGQSGRMIRYSVYETWDKGKKKSLIGLFIDWFKYDLQAGYEKDIAESTSLTSNTKSAFKRLRWVVECMLRCCSNHPPPMPDTPQQRVEWEAALEPIASAALAQMKNTLGLDINDTITQNTLTGNTVARKQIIEQRSLPQDTPLESTFSAQPKSGKRKRDDDTVRVDV